MQGVPWYRWQHQEPGDRSAALPPLPGQNYQPGPGIGTEVLIAGDVFEFLAGLRSRPPFKTSHLFKNLSIKISSERRYR